MVEDTFRLVLVSFGLGKSLRRRNEPPRTPLKKPQIRSWTYHAMLARTKKEHARAARMASAGSFNISFMLSHRRWMSPEVLTSPHLGTEGRATGARDVSRACSATEVRSFSQRGDRPCSTRGRSDRPRGCASADLEPEERVGGRSKAADPILTLGPGGRHGSFGRSLEVLAQRLQLVLEPIGTHVRLQVVERSRPRHPPT